MKKFEVKFKRVFKDFNNKGKVPARKVIEVFQTVEANTFKEARDMIRAEHDNAMSIDIQEVPHSFRDNTPEETAAFNLKYNKSIVNKVIFALGLLIISNTGLKPFFSGYFFFLCS